MPISMQFSFKNVTFYVIIQDYSQNLSPHIQFPKMSEKFKFEQKIHSAFHTIYLFRIKGKCVVPLPSPLTAQNCHTGDVHHHVVRVCMSVCFVY